MSVKIKKINSMTVKELINCFEKAGESSAYRKHLVRELNGRANDVKDISIEGRRNAKEASDVLKKILSN